MNAIGKYLVVVAEEEAEVKAKSGLIMGSEDKKSIRYKKGVIKSVGTTVDPALKKDHVIRYDCHNALSMLIDGNPYDIIQERDVILIL